MTVPIGIERSMSRPGKYQQSSLALRIETQLDPRRVVPHRCNEYCCRCHVVFLLPSCCTSRLLRDNPEVTQSPDWFLLSSSFCPPAHLAQPRRKHYVHCLVMGLSKAAVNGMDQGAYEMLRKMYNSLDIPGPMVVAAEDMEINHLCKHPFCK